MFKNSKIDFLLIVICFLLLPAKLYAQNNKAYQQDSLKVRVLLVTADNCIKSASANCNKYLNNALKISTALGSPFLKSLCYSSFANAERRNRTALLFKYDSLSIGNARQSKNDSLLITTLLHLAEDFCAVNRPEKAKHLIDECFLLLEKYHDTRLNLLTKYEQAFYFFKNREFTKAGNYYRVALKYAETLSDQYWIAKLQRSICLADVFGYKHTDSSISIFNTLDYFRKNDLFEAANCLAVIGHTYRLKGNYEKGASYFNEAAAIYKSCKYHLQEADMYILIAENFLIKKEFDKGFSLTAKAENICSNLRYYFGVNHAYLSYGRLYGAAGDFVRSDIYFSKVDSALKVDPNKILHAALLSYKVTTNIYSGNVEAANKLIDSAAKSITTLLSKEVTDSMINRATSTGLLSKPEAVDLKKYTRTGKLDTVLWNKKAALEGLNPYTGDLPKFNSQYNEIFNRQTTEMETRYRTKIKDDSLKNVINENRISQLKIDRQNWLILFIAIITLAVGVILYQINKARERVVQEKKTIELLKVEADHRIKNTLNIINTIVRNVKSQSSDKLSFGLLEERVEPLMILYEMLSKNNVDEINLQDYFEKICNNLKSSYNQLQNIQVHVDTPVMLDGKKAGTVGLMVNELVTNAFKHAFPPEALHKKSQPGEIWVACKKDAAGGYNLHVSDSGIGFKEMVVNINSKGLLQVKALAEQLSATITEKSGEGVLFEFYFM